MLIDEIKSRITPADWMLTHHGRKVTNGRCVSFRPNASNPSSLHLDGTHWTDFGTGHHGDVIDMVAEDMYNGDLGKAVRHLAKELGIETHADVSHAINLLEADCQRYESNMTDEHFAYLAKRGIRRDTAKELRIGFCKDGQLADRLIIPYIVHARVRYFVGREWHQSQAKYMKLRRTDENIHPIWGVDSLDREGPVFIAEGAFDAMSVYQEGFPVVSAITGQFSHSQLYDLYPLLRGRRVIVCMDYDPQSHAGQKFTDKLARDLFMRGFDVRANFLQGTDKVDVSELYQANPTRDTIQKIIDDALPYGQVVCATRKPDEVEALLRESARRVPAETFLAMCNATRGNESLNHDTFSALCSVLQRPPSELTIATEFADKYQYVYQPRMGWYEWDGVIWRQRDENVVREKAGKLCGRFQTSRLSEGVYKLLKANLCREAMMDVDGDIIVFPNGEFSMSSMTFTPSHDPAHYATVCMEYPYDAEARCPVWDSFVEDVTDAEPSRMEFIRQMFGYCLQRDARHQVAFCLLGEGSNGKSVLLSVLEAFLGRVNCTHVEIASLGEAFQRIGLMNSMANICNDMRSDVSGTESVFKAVVSGDPINGCYKGKDFISFTPYCKMVFSSNRMPTAREVNYSYVRRFRFLRFPITYTDDGPNRKDTSLTSKLLAELPGIFNFAVQGARNLIADGKLIVTCDQPANEQELIEASNPLITFLDDCTEQYGNPSGSRTEVILRYEEWCKSRSIRPLPPKAFWLRLRETANVEDRRNHTARMAIISPGKQWRGYDA